MSNSRIALSTNNGVLKEPIWNTPGSKYQHFCVIIMVVVEKTGLPDEALAKSGGGGGSRTPVRKYST
jgi:hypothetical protein